jgi:hypothetical protein
MGLVQGRNKTDDACGKMIGMGTMDRGFAVFIFYICVVLLGF